MLRVRQLKAIEMTSFIPADQGISRPTKLEMLPSPIDPAAEIGREIAKTVTIIDALDAARAKAAREKMGQERAGGLFEDAGLERQAAYAHDRLFRLEKAICLQPASTAEGALAQ